MSPQIISMPSKHSKASPLSKSKFSFVLAAMMLITELKLSSLSIEEIYPPASVIKRDAAA